MYEYKVLSFKERQEKLQALGRVLVPYMLGAVLTAMTATWVGEGQTPTPLQTAPRPAIELRTEPVMPPFVRGWGSYPARKTPPGEALRSSETFTPLPPDTFACETVDGQAICRKAPPAPPGGQGRPGIGWLTCEDVGVDKTVCGNGAGLKDD
jgi:hypothetical protein